MDAAALNIALTFGRDDQTWMRRASVALPRFWDGHGVPPQRGDLLRIGGRLFEVQLRVWEHDGDEPVLRLYLGSGRAEGDTSFQGLGG